MTGESSTTLALTSNTVKVNLTQDFSLVAQVTFINGSFINGTVTIMRPIYLNGGMVTCNLETLTLNTPANTGKFLVTGIGRDNLLLKDIACLHHIFFHAQQSL